MKSVVTYLLFRKDTLEKQLKQAQEQKDQEVYTKNLKTEIQLVLNLIEVVQDGMYTIANLTEFLKDTVKDKLK